MNFTPAGKTTPKGEDREAAGNTKGLVRSNPPVTGSDWRLWAGKGCPAGVKKERPYSAASVPLPAAMGILAASPAPTSSTSDSSIRRWRASSASCWRAHIRA